MFNTAGTSTDIIPITDKIECVAPQWVHITYIWREDGLITGEVFHTIMVYLAKIGVVVCKLQENLW